MFKVIKALSGVKTHFMHVDTPKFYREKSLSTMMTAI